MAWLCKRTLIKFNKKACAGRSADDLGVDQKAATPKRALNAATAASRQRSFTRMPLQ